jgi:uncharacterized protein YaiI (UPF0178 family)
MSLGQRLLRKPPKALATASFMIEPGRQVNHRMSLLAQRWQRDLACCYRVAQMTNLLPQPAAIQIYVDADACPVKAEAVRVAERHGLAVHMVANAWMRLPESTLVNRVVVTDGFDAADNWIAERIGPVDIAVTADIPLASRCLKAGARVIGNTGKPFTRESIGMALAMRDLMAHLRETGELQGGNASFSRADRSRFLEAMEAAVQAIKRGRA